MDGEDFDDPDGANIANPVTMSRRREGGVGRFKHVQGFRGDEPVEYILVM
jgi:hypothetical protein